jgi:hypothetical protein
VIFKPCSIGEVVAPRSVRAEWFHDAQRWVTVFALDGKEHAVGCRVDGDGVRGFRQVRSSQGAD